MVSSKVEKSDTLTMLDVRHCTRWSRIKMAISMLLTPFSIALIGRSMRVDIRMSDEYPTIHVFHMKKTAEAWAKYQEEQAEEEARRQRFPIPTGPDSPEPPVE